MNTNLKYNKITINEKVYTIEILLQIAINNDIDILSRAEDKIQKYYDEFSVEEIMGADSYYENNPPPSYKRMGVIIAQIISDIFGNSLISDEEWGIVVQELHVNCGYI
jgi:hypothetical protein